MTWIENIPEENVYISALTLGELYKGAYRIGDARKAKKIKSWLETDVVARFGDHILPVDNDVVVAWGALCAESERKGVPRPVIDSLLAATAQVHHLTLATRNVSDFLFTGISVVNPWEGI